MVQLSHSYMTTGKTIALTRQTFVGKVMNGISAFMKKKKKTPEGFSGGPVVDSTLPLHGAQV